MYCSEAYQEPERPSHHEEPERQPVTAGEATLRRFNLLGRLKQEKAERRAEIKAGLPQMTLDETRQAGYSFRHRLSHTIVQDGYHRSFAEMTDLILAQRARRKEAGPRSPLWNKPLIEHEVEKLSLLAKYLMLAEDAWYKDEFEDVYNEYRTLAQFFRSTNDRWLSDHFFQRSFEFAQRVPGEDGERLVAEAYGNIGLVEEQKDNLDAALKYFLQYQLLTADHPDWYVDNDRSQDTQHAHACCCVTNVYMRLAEHSHRDLAGALEFYLLGHKAAREGGDTRKIADATFLLAVAYEKNQQSELAIWHLEEYMELCNELMDHQGVGRAYQTLAECYQSLGAMDKSLEFLTELLTVAENLNDLSGQNRACKDLAGLYNHFGVFDKALELGQRAFDVCRKLGSHTLANEAATYCGIAQAHLNMYEYTCHVELTSRPVIERMLDWKDDRTWVMDQPITDEVSPVRREQARITLAREKRSTATKRKISMDRSRSVSKSVVRRKTTMPRPTPVHQ